MSNRTEAQITYAAELKAAHLAQIEALTAPGLTREERVERFMAAARFSATQKRSIHTLAPGWRNLSAAYLAWCEGDAPYSLFGAMPGCGCPVAEVTMGRKIPGIPDHIPCDWSPTAEDLLPFARIQQERWLAAALS